MTEKQVTDKQIEALAQEASLAGDDAQVVLCDAALSGDAVARAECERVIRVAANEAVS